MTSAQAYVKLIAAKLALDFAEYDVYLALWSLEMAIKRLEEGK